MARQRRFEWHKEGDQIFQMRFSDELPSSAALTGTPTVRVDKLTEGSDPEDWNNVSAGASQSITVSGVTIVDAVDDDGTTVLGTNQAVQFQLNADAATMPDETDEPVPGRNYRVVVTADRDDAGDVVGKVGLTIHP